MVDHDNEPQQPEPDEERPHEEQGTPIRQRYSKLVVIPGLRWGEDDEVWIEPAQD